MRREVANIPVRKAMNDLLAAYSEAAHWESYYQKHEAISDTAHHADWQARRDACSKAYYALEALL